MTDESTKEMLIASAKTEFLEKGYEKASLRSICSKANVTTGALYFFFKNKSDLFDSIVAGTAEKLLQLVERQTEAELNGSEKSSEYQREMNIFLFENKDIVRILFEKSEGTKYEAFRSRYGEAVSKGFFMFYDNNGGTAEYRDIMKLLVRMRVQGYIEILKGDYDMEKMMKLSELIEVYGDGGFAEMMKQFKGITEGTV